MGRGPMRTVRRTLAGIALLLAHGGWAVEPPAAVVASHLAGQSIYRDGLLLSGEPVRAVVQKGVVLSGAAAACVNCHRRSGLGGSEGQIPVRPIAGRLLFTSSQTGRARRWKGTDRKSTRLNSSHQKISYAVFCLKKKKHEANLIHRKKRRNSMARQRAG